MPHQLAKPNTVLVIEGFPRSANTFCEVALRASQGADFSITHHGHHIVHLKHALSLGKPCVVLIREPASAIASLLNLGSRDDIGQLCDWYFDYYTYALKVFDRVLIWDFESVTHKFLGMVALANHRFGLELIVPELNHVSKDKIYSIADQMRGYTHVESPQIDPAHQIQRREELDSCIEIVRGHPAIKKCTGIYLKIMALAAASK